MKLLAVLLCVVIVALVAANAGAGLSFDGLLVALGPLFALASVAVVVLPENAPKPVDAVAGVLVSRAPPTSSYLL